MRFLVLLSVFCFFQISVPAGLQLARDGKTDYTIVYTGREKEAAEELKLHLKQITTADFNMIEETSGLEVSGPAIYLGATAFTAKHGIDSSVLEPEEYLIRSYGNDLVITGGKTHGTLYGVYELLERIGCRWFAYDTTVIPKEKDLHIEAVNLRHIPDYDYRYICDDFSRAQSRGQDVYDKTLLQKRRLRVTLNSWSDISTRYGTCHTFYRFVDPDVYFPTHPEYFSMDASGKRFRGTLPPDGRQGGSLCLTNPDVLEITWKKLVEYIEIDREKIPEEKRPKVYDISNMDQMSYLCKCPECRKIIEREGGDSGLLIHFLNQIGTRLKKNYPDVKLTTLAYVSCSEAPKHIRPLDNIIFRWCNLYTINDCYRPITHEYNAAQKKEFDGWKAIGANMGLWEYWNMGGRYFRPMRVETCINSIPENIRYFKKNGATRYFCEFEPDYDRHYSQNFAFLNLYVAYKLLNDVSLDEEQLIREFMKGYYGPAEKPMTEFLTMLRGKMGEVDFRMHAFQPNRPYETENFMRRVWNLLMDAYHATVPGSLYRTHIENEMLPPISVILRANYKIGDRDFLLKKYRELRTKHIDSLAVSQKWKDTFRKQAESEMDDFIQLDLIVPDQFKGKEIIHLGWPKISWSRGDKTGMYVEDTEGVGGKTVAAPQSPRSTHDMKQTVHKGLTPLDFGFYDSETKRSFRKPYHPNNIPQDEKYHWYEIGQFELGRQTILWGFYWGTQCNLANFYRTADGMEKANLVNAWVHIKITGPAYVRDSKKQNGIFWDQVILVWPQGK